jgi:2,3-bisphosphoglycerate-dependent phosphoglycerate mutase
MFTLPADPSHFITLLRHGESDGNVTLVIQGQLNYSLSKSGRVQISQLSDRWEKEGRQFDMIISSSLRRAAESAQILSMRLNTPVEIDSIWQERNVGKIQGLSRHQAEEQFPLSPELHPFTPVGESGESQWALWLRAGRAVESLLIRPPGRYLVVSHGGLLNLVMYVILGISLHGSYQGPRFAFRNACFADLEYYPKQHRFSVLSLNDQLHLHSATGEEK